MHSDQAVAVSLVLAVAFMLLDLGELAWPSLSLVCKQRKEALVLGRLGVGANQYRSS